MIIPVEKKLYNPNESGLWWPGKRVNFKFNGAALLISGCGCCGKKYLVVAGQAAISLYNLACDYFKTAGCQIFHQQFREGEYVYGSRVRFNSANEIVATHQAVDYYSVSRFDLEGNLLGEAATGGYAQDFDFDEEGNVYIVGPYDNDYNPTEVVWKYNSTLTSQIWAKEFDNVYSMNRVGLWGDYVFIWDASHDMLRKLLKSDGSLVAASEVDGSRFMEVDSSGNIFMGWLSSNTYTIRKYDSSFNLIWDETFTGGGITYHYSAGMKGKANPLYDEDGNNLNTDDLYATLWGRYGNSYIVKVNSEGVEQWQNDLGSWGSKNIDVNNDLIYTVDGGSLRTYNPDGSLNRTQGGIYLYIGTIAISDYIS